MDEVAISAELRELHRGRGIRRPNIQRWLGAELQRILGIDPSTNDDEARAALTKLLDENTQAFPRDLRYLILMASGVSSDEPFLEQRLAVAERVLDRSPRVLRRRLRTAEQLLGEALAVAHADTRGPFNDHGWRWEDHELDLVLAEDATLTLTRTVRSLTDRPKQIHEAFGIPGRLEPNTDLTFTALEGLEVVEVLRPSKTLWRVALELPKDLARGEIRQTKLQVHVPRAHAMNPFLALAPLRPAHTLKVSIDFGTPPVARRAWVMDGVIASDMAGIGDEVRELSLEESSRVGASFSRPYPGLAYGIGWEWAED